MPRGIVDHAGLKSAASQAIRDLEPRPGRPFNLTKIGHVVLMASDIERSVRFYTGVLGFRVSDVYPETMMKGRMVFMRCARALPPSGAEFAEHPARQAIQRPGSFFV